MLNLLIYIGACIGGFVLARNFVVNRLRFVDAIRSPLFPWIAGIGAALVTWPLAALPLFFTTSFSAFIGLGTGLGTRSGVRQLKSGV
jgi:hypothetical protein